MDRATIVHSKPAQILAVLLFIQTALVVSIIFNISPARQVLGFLYVTTMPGIVVVELLMPKLERVERIIFAIGVSLAFFMGIGFLVNSLGPLLGALAPLGSASLIPVTSIIMDALAFFAWRTHDDTNNHVSVVKPNNNAKRDLLTPFLCLLPILSIVGALLVSISPHSNNLVLLLMLLVVSILVVSIAFYKQLSSETYALILFAIALALLYHFAFFSQYMIGGDIFAEYSALSYTLQNSYWNVQTLGRLNAMLSVTILPTIYSNITGVNGTWVFKAIYPSLFAIVPVGLYQLFKSQVQERLAFFSVFSFMSNFIFFSSLPELPRQMIGELFYVLVFLTITKKDLTTTTRWLFFGIFSFGIVVSHYAIAYIFLGFIVAYWLVVRIMKRKGLIDLGMITFFATILFAWYIYTASASTFGDLLNTVNNLGQNFFSDFFNPQSRGSTTLAGLGTPVGTTILRLTGQYIYNLTELLILVGITATLVKTKRQFLRNDYHIFASFSLVLLVTCVVIPGFAQTFNMERFYHVSLFFLAPFCILGGIYILNSISRRKVNANHLCLIVVLVVLIPAFLFQTGFIYEATKEKCNSIPLSSYRFSPLEIARVGILGVPSVSGAEWLLQNKDIPTIVYVDRISSLNTYYIDVPNAVLFSLDTPIPFGSMIYLTQYSLSSSVVYVEGFYLNLTQAIPSSDTRNTIYSNSLCEIYKVNQ